MTSAAALTKKNCPACHQMHHCCSSLKTALPPPWSSAACPRNANLSRTEYPDRLPPRREVLQSSFAPLHPAPDSPPAPAFLSRFAKIAQVTPGTSHHGVKQSRLLQPSHAAAAVLCQRKHSTSDARPPRCRSWSTNSGKSTRADCGRLSRRCRRASLRLSLESAPTSACAHYRCNIIHQLPSAGATSAGILLRRLCSCVTIKTVMPIDWLKLRMSSMISVPVRLSRLPVGSSAKSSLGRLIRARANDARCCSPPEVPWADVPAARSIHPFQRVPASASAPADRLRQTQREFHIFQQRHAGYQVKL